MRNLKRALSLTLASVMLLGMMVVGSSAAGFPDVDDTKNVEAIEVLQAVAVMVGDKDTGNFRPDAPVSRAEMAVIMSNLLGLTTSYYVSTCPFTDVSGSYDWARGPVGACYATGVISGRTATTFDPSATVTAVEAAAMMMRALGYFKYTEDYAGGFNLAVVTQANKIGLFSGIEGDATSPLTRNQVAKLTLNALQANLVDFTGTPGIEVNGVKIGYKPEYTFRSGTDRKYFAISGQGNTTDGTTNQAYIQLGEQRYNGDLRLNDNATDDFGRPSRYWEYDGKAIGTYAKEELIRKEYTKAVTGRELYDLLGSDLLNEKVWSLDVAIDGIEDYDIDNSLFNGTALNRNNKATVGGTGNGVLTQVFVDTDKHEIDIAIINTYLARATADYDTRKEILSLDVYGIKEKTGYKDNYVKTITANEDKDDFKVSVDDFDVAGVKKGDSFLVTVADGAIQSMKDVEIMSAVEISSFQSRKPADRGTGNLTTGGEKYNFADTAEYDNPCLKAYTDGSANINLKDLTYNVYLDEYGYVIGVIEVDKPTNYLFITGVNSGDNNLSNITVRANAIFLDGTMETIEINRGESDLTLLGNNDDSVVNKWFTYTKDKKDIYTLDAIAEPTTGNGAGVKGQSHITWNNSTSVNRTVNKKHIYMSTVTEELNAAATNEALAYGNDKSVYIAADIDRIITTGSTTDIVISGVSSAITGIDNVDIKAMTAAEAQAAAPNPTTPALDNTSHGVYTLYDADGWIIAMVIVGEDNGSNNAFAYVHNDSVAQEYLMDDQTYKWERTVVIDGVETTLTEVNDTRISLLEKMDENKWYRVRTNANNEVTAILGSPVADSTLDSDTDVGGKFGDWNLDWDTVPTAYNTDYDAANQTLVDSFTEPGVDTVLYHEAFINKVPRADGHTLYVEQAVNSGLRFTKDVKVILDQTNDNKRETFFGEGEADVKQFLKDLHPSNDTAPYTYDYEISAMLKGGVADVIVIKDLVADGDGGETPIVGEKIDGLWINLTDTAGLTITGVTTKATAPSEEGTVAGIIDALTKAGYSFDEKDGVVYDAATSEWQFNVYKMIGGQRVNRQWTWNPTSDAIDTNGTPMTVNGTAVVVSATTNWTTIAGELNITEVGKWVKLGDGTYEAENAGTGAVAGAKAEFGYYKVTKPADTAAINGLTYKVTVPAADTFVKKGAQVTLTFEISGTSSAATAKTITTVAANATINGADGDALTGTGTTTGITSVVRTNSNTITVTPKGSDAVSATYTVTLTVTGAADVAITLPS